MIAVSISHRNRQRRRAKARQLRLSGKQMPSLTAAQIRSHCTALTEYLRDANPQALAALGLVEDSGHGLLLYVVDRGQAQPEQAAAGEKVDLVGYRNVTPQFEAAQREMLALIGKARGKDPIEHYVLSWADDEHPSPQQVDNAVDTMTRVLGLERHQAIYAAHSSTEHYHVHIAINRVDPETHRLVAAGDGWQVNAALQAAALIEHQQGWSSSPGAIYTADDRGVRHIESGLLVRFADGSPTGKNPPDRRMSDGSVERRLSNGAHGYEKRTGRQSFERILMTVAGPIIEHASSWDELHANLAHEGLGYQKYGTNGARIAMGDRALSASIAARNASLTVLEKPNRLGSFTPSKVAAVSLRKPRYLRGQERRPEYESARAAHIAAVTAARSQVEAARQHARAKIIAWRRAFAAEINATDWRGRRDQLNAARQLFGQHFQSIEMDLISAIEPALTGLRAATRFPSYEAWCSGASGPSIPQALALSDPAMVAPSGDHGPAATPIAGYEHHWHNATCVYQRMGGRSAFSDRGPILAIHSLNRADVTAALKLAQQKWGSVELISGSDEFLRLAVQIADAEKIKLTGEVAKRYESQAAHARVTLSPAAKAPLPATLSLDGVPTADAREQPLRDNNAGQSQVVRTSMYEAACEEMRGDHALIDAWLDARNQDPRALATLRPLASAATADPQARALLTQWQAEGLKAAIELLRHAADHRRLRAAAHKHLSSMQSLGWP